jgi:hypothetical protein
MSQEYLTTGKPTNSKSKAAAFNAAMKGGMEVSELISILSGVKKYTPRTLQDLGLHRTARAIDTDDKPLPPDGGPAILIDRQRKCWFRLARVKDDKVIITAWHWPHGEATVPLNHFETIERVSSISF